MDDGEAPILQISFETRIFEWRGPQPYFFAKIPAAHVEALRSTARLVTYGWGMIPVEARIGDVAFKTAIYPKDGAYLLPLKAAARRKANVTAGDLIAVELAVRPNWR